MGEHAVEPLSARLSWEEVHQLEVLMHACVVTRTTPRFELHLSDLRWPARGRVDAPCGGAGASGLPADASSTVSS
jgi:hypothetical protein